MAPFHLPITKIRSTLQVQGQAQGKGHIDAIERLGRHVTASSAMNYNSDESSQVSKRSLTLRYWCNMFRCVNGNRFYYYFFCDELELNSVFREGIYFTQFIRFNSLKKSDSGTGINLNLKGSIHYHSRFQQHSIWNYSEKINKLHCIIPSPSPLGA